MDCSLRSIFQPLPVLENSVHRRSQSEWTRSTHPNHLRSTQIHCLFERLIPTTKYSMPKLGTTAAIILLYSSNLTKKIVLALTVFPHLPIRCIFWAVQWDRSCRFCVECTPVRWLSRWCHRCLGSVGRVGRNKRDVQPLVNAHLPQ